MVQTMRSKIYTNRRFFEIYKSQRFLKSTLVLDVTFMVEIGRSQNGSRNTAILTKFPINVIYLLSKSHKSMLNVIYYQDQFSQVLNGKYSVLLYLCYSFVCAQSLPFMRTNGYFIQMTIFHKLGTSRFRPCGLKCKPVLNFRPCGLKSIPILENEWKNGGRIPPFSRNIRWLTIPPFLLVMISEPRFATH